MVTGTDKAKSAKKMRNLLPVFIGAVLLIALAFYLFAGEMLLSNGLASELAGDLISAQKNYRRAATVLGLVGKTNKKIEALRSLMSVNTALSRTLAAYENAIELREALQSNDASPQELADAMAIEAYYLYLLDRTEQAEIALTNAFAVDETNPRSYYVKGLLRTASRNLEDAIACFNFAIDEGKIRGDKNLASYYVGRAEAQSLNTNYRRALDDAKRALELGLNDISVYMITTKCAIYLADYDQAIKVCKEALDLYPNNALFESYLATISMLKLDFTTAQKRFESIAERGGTLTQEAEFSLGISFYCLGKWEEARRAIINSSEVDPVLSAVLLFLIEANSVTGKEKALEQLIARSRLLNSPRLDFYTQVYQQKHSFEQLAHLVSLRKIRFASEDLERDALGDYASVFRPPIDGLPWEEMAFVFGSAAIIMGKQEVARPFFADVLESKNHFYWVYILSNFAASLIK